MRSDHVGAGCEQDDVFMCSHNKRSVSSDAGEVMWLVRLGNTDKYK